jgi:hypothetical protein
MVDNDQKIQETFLLINLINKKKEVYNEKP